MGPAERCDLFVDFSRLRRQATSCSAARRRSRPRRSASLLPPASAPEEELMRVPRAREAQAQEDAGRGRCPKKLRALPAWTRELPRSPTARSCFGQALDRRRRDTIWTINGAPYDPERRWSRARSSARPRRGCWSTRPSRATTSTCTPSTGRSSRATAARRRADEDVLKETFRLDPGETLAVGAKFTDHLGQVPHPLPHAQPRGPRDDDHVRDRRAGRRRPRRAPLGAPSPRRSSASERVLVPLDTLTPSRGARARGDARRAGAGAGPAGPAAERAAAPRESNGAAYLCRLPGSGAEA